MISMTRYGNAKIIIKRNSMLLLEAVEIKQRLKGVLSLPQPQHTVFVNPCCGFIMTEGLYYKRSAQQSLGAEWKRVWGCHQL